MSDLRSATQDIHHAAEETGISKMLVSGDFTASEWAAFLSNQYLIRKAIEDRNIIQLNDLLSAPRVRADLASLDVSGEVGVVDSTIEYVNYLNQLSEHLVWSHIYAIYLGDLYGGQMIRKSLKDKLPVSMLEFENRTELVAYVRQNLVDADANEAVAAFEWIIKIYQDLYQSLRG
jgi:heme oxygenase